MDFCLNQKSTFSPWLHVIWTTFAFRAPIHRSVSSRLRTRSSHIWLPRVYQHVFSIIFTNVWVLRTVPHLQTLIFFRWAFSLWCIAANCVQSIALLCIPHWCSCCFSKLGLLLSNVGNRLSTEKNLKHVETWPELPRVNVNLLSLSGVCVINLVSVSYFP